MIINDAIAQVFLAAILGGIGWLLRKVGKLSEDVAAIKVRLKMGENG